MRCHYIACLSAFLLLLSAAYAQEGVISGAEPPDISLTEPGIRAEDVRLHIKFLASEAMEGRGTGTPGEHLATDYAAQVFEHIGLVPAGDGGTWFQPFEFTAGVSLGSGNNLCIARTGAPKPDCFPVDTAWRPVAFSKSGPVDASLVFAGYGIVAPALESLPEYDSYTHLDVHGKWVVVFRYLPENVSTERRLHLTQYAGLRYKAMLARDRGAIGIVFISGPNSKVKDPLVDLRFDASFSGTSIATVSVDDTIGEGLLSTAGRTLESLQTELDTGEAVMGFEPPDTRLQANIDIVQEKRTGRNVIGRLNCGESDSESVVVVGAHIDHLGRGAGAGSLAGDYEKDRIHYGADDNASGVAGLFEIAQLLAQRKADGQLPAKRDILFAAWSGEELGLLGSARFVKTYKSISESESLWPAIAAYVNMDMIGRLTGPAVLGGIGSSPIWPDAVEVWANTVDGLQFTIQDDNYLPTDATSFYVRGVPFLNAFTGAHAEYHTPRDTPEKINYEGAARIAQFLAAAVEDLASRAEAPAYTPAPKPREASSGAGLRAYLGTIPDYSQDDGKGVKLAGVAEGGPAATAGLRGGDVVVEFAGKKIENIYDYTYALEAVKIGEPVDIVVRRGEEQLTLKVTPGARE